MRNRRGVALFVAMFFVAGIGALALTAIYLTANASLLSKTYEKEDDLKYASEAALAIGKAELNYNPAALPSSSYVQLFSNMPLKTADNQTVPGITVNLWVGPTGSTSGQFGRFASVVAQALSNNGTGFVRRLELTQESFAKYAYWTNNETNNGSPIYFANGDQLWGPVWSNDTIHINTTGATFHDVVGTAKIISGTSYGTFSKGYQIHGKAISLPSLSSLSGLSALATVSGFNFTAPTTGDETTVRMRIEFVATDMATPPAGDSTDLADGFFRVYTANSGQTAWLRGDWPNNPLTSPLSMTTCGDWHHVAGDTALKFFPFYTHVHSGGANSWFDTVTAGGMSGGVNSTNVTKAHTEGDSTATSTKFSKLLQNHSVRCYLGGDPHLVAVARDTSSFSAAQKHKGGDDTTFTATDRFGHWTQYSATPNSTIATKRPADAKYLFPLYRGFNTNTKGVIYVSGTVGISGVLGGDVTLYTPNTIVLLGDTRYASDPALGLCIDILGLISGANTVVADNAINTPQSIGALYKSFDATPDFYLHGVVMALGTSFEVQNYSTGPTNALTCQGSSDGRGCLYLTGGVIQNNRGAVGTSTGTGYVKRYSYDACAIQNPPPYFPTTGQFQDNRYYELDPVRFNVGSLYRSLTPH